MAKYAIESYLLDRANIHDVVTKMCLYLDMSKWIELENEVFADEVLVDYTTMFGGQPKIFTGKGQVESWKMQLEGCGADKWQHVNTCLLIELPQPGENVTAPKEVPVIGNSFVTLHRKTEGEPVEVQNGGGFNLKLVKTEKAGNPWRICALAANLAWIRGSWEELKGGKQD